MVCVYVHFFDIKTKKNEIKKKLDRPEFEPTIYVSGAILTNHTTTVESTTSLNYQRISRNCTKTFISVIARNIPIAHDPSRKAIYSVLIP